jgi:hypothetical protein
MKGNFSYISFMKNMLLIIALLCLSAAGMAQSSVPKMELKRTGFVGPDSTKNYIVLDMPKMTKADLYKKTLTYLNGIYNNPGKVISSVDGESITVNGFTDEVKGALQWYKYPMSYNINLQFKNGKIRIAPSITNLKEIWSDDEPPRQFYISNTDSPNSIEINCVWMKSKKDDSYFLLNQKLKLSIDKWINQYVAGISNGLSESW